MDTKASSTPQDAGEPPVDDPAFLEAVHTGHETSDVNVRGLFVFAFALMFSVVVILVGLVAVAGAFGLLNRKIDTYRPTREPGACEAGGRPARDAQAQCG